LVGTHTVTDAELCFREIKNRVPAGTSVRLLTGHNENDEAAIFESAGEVGIVTVATQIAGRGVDIRLSDEAKANGGLLLIGRGHSRLLRQDRQFLGRAGRHGDPFSALFVCSLEDSFFQALRAIRFIESLYKGLVPEDEPVESRMVQQQVRLIQRQFRWMQLRNRRVRIVLDFVDEQVGNAISGWFKRVQLSPPEAESIPAECPPDFIDHLIARFLDTNVQSMLRGRRVLTRSQAEQVAAIVAEIIQADSDARHRLQLNYMGRRGRDVRLLVKRALETAIAKAESANSEIRNRLDETIEALRESERLMQSVLALGRVRRNIARRLAQLEGAHAAAPALPPGTDGGVATAVLGPESITAETAPVAPPTPGSDVQRFIRQDEFAIEELDALVRSSSRDDLLALLTHVEEIDRNLRARRTTLLNANGSGAGSLADAQRRAERTCRSVAHWSIRVAWATFIKDRDVIERSLRGAAMPSSQYFRVLTDRLLQRWQAVDAEMASSTLANLVASGQPAALDGLYTLRDNYQATEMVQRERKVDWEASPSDTSTETRRTLDRLIEEFLRHQSLEVSDDLDEARLVRVFRDFLSSAPLSTLQTPVQIHQRVLGWLADQRLRGVPDRRWRADLVWVQRFVAFMHERGAVATLPGPSTRLWVSLQRLRNNLAEFRTQVPVIVGVALVGLYLVLSPLRVGPPWDLPTGVRLLDSLIAGGLLTSRAFVGPVAAGLTVGFLLAGLLRPRSSQETRSGLLVLSAVPFVGLALWTIDWPLGDPVSWRTGTAVAALAGMTLLFVLSMTALTNLELWSSVRLLPLWLSYCAAFVFLPTLVQIGSLPLVLTTVAFGFVVVGLMLLRLINTTEIAVTSLAGHQTEQAEPQPSLVGSAYRIEGTVNPTVYLVALTLAFSIQQIVEFIVVAAGYPRLTFITSTVVATVAFGLALVVLTWRVVSRRCSPRAWRKRLNEARQTLDASYADQDLANVLRSIAKRVLARESVAQVALIGGVTAALWGRKVPGLDLPPALLLIVGAALFASQSRAFGQSMFELLVLRTPSAPPVLDLPIVLEDEGADVSRARRLLRYLRRRLGRIVVGAIALFGVSAKLVDAVEVGQLIARLLD
jgi:hypothetical protein